jgi:superoxide dismutase
VNEKDEVVRRGFFQDATKVMGSGWVGLGYERAAIVRLQVLVGQYRKQLCLPGR